MCRDRFIELYPKINSGCATAGNGLEHFRKFREIFFLLYTIPLILFHDLNVLGANKTNIFLKTYTERHVVLIVLILMTINFIDSHFITDGLSDDLKAVSKKK